MPAAQEDVDVYHKNLQVLKDKNKTLHDLVHPEESVLGRKLEENMQSVAIYVMARPSLRPLQRNIRSIFRWSGGQPHCAFGANRP